MQCGAVRMQPILSYNTHDKYPVARLAVRDIGSPYTNID